MTKVVKQLAGLQDLALGTGDVQQERNGAPTTITKIDIAKSLPSILALPAVDISKHKRAVVYSETSYDNYLYSEVDDTGIPSTGNPGSWLKINSGFNELWTPEEGTLGATAKDGLYTYGFTYTEDSSGVTAIGSAGTTLQSMGSLGVAPITGIKQGIYFSIEADMPVDGGELYVGLTDGSIVDSGATGIVALRIAKTVGDIYQFRLGDFLAADVSSIVDSTVGLSLPGKIFCLSFQETAPDVVTITAYLDGVELLSYTTTARASTAGANTVAYYGSFISPVSIKGYFYPDPEVPGVTLYTEAGGVDTSNLVPGINYLVAGLSSPAHSTGIGKLENGILVQAIAGGGLGGKSVNHDVLNPDVEETVRAAYDFVNGLKIGGEFIVPANGKFTEISWHDDDDVLASLGYTYLETFNTVGTAREFSLDEPSTVLLGGEHITFIATEDDSQYFVTANTSIKIYKNGALSDQGTTFYPEGKNIYHFVYRGAHGDWLAIAVPFSDQLWRLQQNGSITFNSSFNYVLQQSVGAMVGYVPRASLSGPFFIKAHLASAASIVKLDKGYSGDSFIVHDGEDTVVSELRLENGDLILATPLGNAWYFTIINKANLSRTYKDSSFTAVKNTSYTTNVYVDVTAPTSGVSTVGDWFSVEAKSSRVSIIGDANLVVNGRAIGQTSFILHRNQVAFAMYDGTTWHLTVAGAAYVTFATNTTTTLALTFSELNQETTLTNANLVTVTLPSYSNLIRGQGFDFVRKDNTAGQYTAFTPDGSEKILSQLGTHTVTKANATKGQYIRVWFSGSTDTGWIIEATDG